MVGDFGRHVPAFADGLFGTALFASRSPAANDDEG
jgi:hypothetical protein